MENLCSLLQMPQQQSHLYRSATGQERYCWPISETATFARFRLRHARPYFIDKRMSDKMDIHIVSAIEIYFERENNKHVIDEPCDLGYTLCSPGPDLRAYIPEDRNTGP